ncbi:hypothetical protein [Rubripirellula reticaptiva]|uniref:Uncharacterized protein n=1 Tax=Rubripirellula reticaptiva TaxID=2528013 RepID=A0A5C6EKY9_9BACT|nr:hypothetical protein [Rubripirellula reticaptiva]TWU49498.1 hypothetical protein Poly59_41130 [Rubripirellula reticaptiva]
MRDQESPTIDGDHTTGERHEELALPEVEQQVWDVILRYASRYLSFDNPIGTPLDLAVTTFKSHLKNHPMPLTTDKNDPTFKLLLKKLNAKNAQYHRDAVKYYQLFRNDASLSTNGDEEDGGSFLANLEQPDLPPSNEKGKVTKADRMKLAAIAETGEWIKETLSAMLENGVWVQIALLGLSGKENSEVASALKISIAKVERSRQKINQLMTKACLDAAEQRLE